MRQFFSILNFEFSSYLKNKTFVGTTVILVALIGIVLSFPRVSEMFNKDSDKDSASTAEKAVVLVSGLQGEENSILTSLAAEMPYKDFKTTDQSVEELMAIVGSEECESAIAITSPTTYSYIVKNLNLSDSTTSAIEKAMTEIYRVKALGELGLTVSQADDILNQTMTGDVIKTGKSQENTFFYTYMLIMALYMSIILYGQFVATSVASEKSTRAMEMLITSANPSSLMFGKVLGAGSAGLLQLSSILASAYIFFNLNQSYWGGNDLISSIFDIPFSLLCYTVLFFILGFFIYAFLFGAVGSLASNVEDINTSSMPLIFLLMAAFFVVMPAMTTGNVDTGIMVAASYVPFTSPMAMFVRIAMGNVSGLEIAISIIILIASTVGIGFISAKIYRIGVLLYGTPPKISNILKNLNK